MIKFKGIFSRKKPSIPILNEDDLRELKELERKSYMEEARKLVVIRGQDRANKELGIKPKKEEPWQI